MNSVKGFIEAYWKAFAGFGVWVFLLVTCYLVPDQWTYVYALFWAGAGSLVAGVFVVGYLRYSKPSKNPVTKKRSWQGEWAWLLAQAAVVLLVVGLSFALRLINIESFVPDDRVAQYRFTAGVFITVFLEQLWLTWMWAWRQVHSRALIREAAAR